MSLKIYLLAALGLMGVVFSLLFVLLPCFSPVTPVLCRGDRQQLQIALTFDDGPNEPYTSQILDILQREHVSATFFLVGKHVQQYPDVVRRILREGHVIGNHTWDHRPLVLMKRIEIEAEIDQWEKIMTSFDFPATKLFRAPHGWKTPILNAVLKEKGYYLIGWTHGVWDSARPGTAVLLQRLKSAAENGAIILLHDGDGSADSADRSQTVAVLSDVIRYYRQAGYRFVTVPQMMREMKDH